MTKQDHLVVNKCNTTFVLYSFKRIYKQFYSNIHLQKDSKSNGSTCRRVWQFGKFWIFAGQIDIDIWEFKKQNNKTSSMFYLSLNT